MKKLNNISLNGLSNEFNYHGLGVKKDLFYEEENGHLFLFSTYGDCGIEDIINGIREDRYEYLINTLNNNKNLIIDWAALEGSTSDYIIYHGFDTEFIEETFCPEMLSHELIKLRTDESGYKNYKYQEYKDGKFIQL